MSQRTRLVSAWETLLRAAAAKTGSKTGAVVSATTRSLTCAATGWTDTANYYQWAVLEFTSGANDGDFVVVNASAVAAGALTLSWRDALAVAPSAADTFTVDFAPLGGASVFLRQPISTTVSATDLPALFIAGEQKRTLRQHSSGNLQGSLESVHELRTDLVSQWRLGNEDDADTADRFFEQLDQLRMCTTGLAGVAQVLRPQTPEDIASFAELDRGQRVFWSTLWTPFRYYV